MPRFCEDPLLLETAFHFGDYLLLQPAQLTAVPAFLAGPEPDAYPRHNERANTGT